MKRDSEFKILLIMEKKDEKFCVMIFESSNVVFEKEGHLKKFSKKQFLPLTLKLLIKCIAFGESSTNTVLSPLLAAALIQKKIFSPYHIKTT